MTAPTKPTIDEPQCVYAECSHPKGLCIGNCKRIMEAKRPEPVAWMQIVENPGEPKRFLLSMECKNNLHRQIKQGGTYQRKPLYTAPPSGVRDADGVVVPRQTVLAAINELRLCKSYDASPAMQQLSALLAAAKEPR